MIKRRNEKVNKCIVFAGCSFTWGQGLYFYSGLPSLIEQPWNKYDHKLVNHTQIEQAARLRFPRLVADHFDTAEIVDPINGGTHQSILKWWNACLFSDIKYLEKYGRTDVPIEDIGLMVFQLTHPNRCSIFFEGEYITFHDINASPKILKRFMKANKLKTFDNYVDYFSKFSLRPVEEFLKKVEAQGVRVLIIAWINENMGYVKKSKFMRERFMTLEYNGKTYETMQDLMAWDDHTRDDLTIRRDFEHFIEPPLDDHPSKKCHRVMADNIIKEIKKRDLL